MSRLLQAKHTFDGDLTLVLKNKQYLFKGCTIKISYYDSSDSIETFDMILNIDDNLRKNLSDEIEQLSIKSPNDTYVFGMKRDKLSYLGKEYKKNMDIQKIIQIDNMACFYFDNYEFISYEDKN